MIQTGDVYHALSHCKSNAANTQNLQAASPYPPPVRYFHPAIN